MKKHLYLFIFSLCWLMSLSASANEQFFYPFETPEDALEWSGCEFDGSNYFDYGYSIFVSNPFGEVRNGKATHVLDYSHTITLEAGNVYTLKGLVLDPLSSSSPFPRAYAQRAPGSNMVIVNVTGAGDDWAEFSTTFFAGESGEYNLSLHFSGGMADFGIFVDELSLEKTPCILSSLNIQGEDEILIPAAGSIKNRYRPYIITSDNVVVDILTSDNIHFSLSDAKGISFDHRDFSLEVTSEAQADSIITISCAIRNYASLTPASMQIKLTDAIFRNDFSESDSLKWESTSDIFKDTDAGNSFLNIPTNDYGEFGYFATIKHIDSQVLLKDVMYVIRAKVRSDNSAAFSAIYVANTGVEADNTVYFNAKNISGESWTEVCSAFIPEKSGVYDIALNLYATYDCNIHIDDVILRAETPSPEYITLHTAGNISVPDEPVKLPVSALLRDQLGNVISENAVNIALLEEYAKIDFDSETNTLTVFPETPVGTYTLKATYSENPQVSASINFSVSYDYITDGSFESTIPNQRWMVSAPHRCDLYMRHDGQSRRALVNCKGDYFMFLNNSYMLLKPGFAYVFNSAFSSPTDCTATLFVETLDGEIIPLAQTEIPAKTTFSSERTPELFLVEQTLLGRPLIYVESKSGSSFTIYIDDLSVRKATIVAVNHHITGMPYVNGSVKTEFNVFNSITGSSDDSACVINWYVSDSRDGYYTEVPYGGRYMYFDTTFLNKYVYFEVTPVCPVTGFSGSTVRSLPFQITYDLTESGDSLPIYTPILKNFPTDDIIFGDTQNHWARRYINTLANSNVVAGKTPDRFAPEDAITRAEFSKMLSIAFSINTRSVLNPFTDIYPEHWSYPYATSLYMAGITKGTSATKFSPKKNLTRQEAAVMIMRIYEKATKAQIPDMQYSFTDSDSISSWATEAVRNAVSLEVITGNPDGSFAPKAILTRAQAAALICRLADVLK